MSFFNEYPYTDEHEINLDWILQKIENIKIRIKELEDAIHDIVVTIPNNGKLTLKRNNVIIGDFTADQATDEDINIVVPENTSELNNDSGFVTSSDLATVATTGDYDDLINTPTIPAAQVNSDWNAISGVAQILNKPTIPAAQVNSDWNANSGVAEILNKPSLATVATTGAYSDLTGQPTIPTVNDATLTIQKNGTNVSTFTANASSNVTANITCEDKITWTVTTNWSYYKDSDGYYHIFGKWLNVTENCSNTYGSVYYKTNGAVLPVTISNALYASIKYISSTDIMSGNVYSITSTRVDWFCYSPKSGLHPADVLEIYIVAKE